MIFRPPADYLTCVDQGILQYWRTLGKARGMETHVGDIEYLMSNPRGIERIYCIRLSEETAEQRVDEIITGIQAGKIPNGLLLGPNTTPTNLSFILVRKGFHLDTSAPCMALDLVEFDYADLLAEPVHVTRVKDKAQLKSWTYIANISLFGCELVSFEQFSDLYDLANTRFFLATIDGIPAAAAMTICQDTIATVEFVTTLSAYRRKGLGTAVMVAALNDLREQGIQTVTLRAEADGVNIYKRLGFQVICPRVVATYGG